MPAGTFGIGEVARATGVHATTIRSWERHGLLRPLTTPGGRRRYGPDELARITAIERMRRVQGLNLRAIRDALAGSSSRPSEPAPGAEVGARIRSLRLA